METTARVVRCRVLGKQSNPCTGEAIDPDGELLICPRHLAMAMRMLDQAKVKVGSPGR